eukprot:6028110-Heterocapsa_arctica.AAC.1
MVQVNTQGYCRTIPLGRNDQAAESHLFSLNSPITPDPGATHNLFRSELGDRSRTPYIRRSWVKPNTSPTGTTSHGAQNQQHLFPDETQATPRPALTGLLTTDHLISRHTRHTLFTSILVTVFEIGDG